MKKIGQANLRRGRFSEENLYYHITSVVNGRQKVFHDPSLARLLITNLRSSDEQGYTCTKTFCVMPDHFHWLLELQSGELSQAVGRVKAGFSRVSGLKVWQDGYFDHGIRSDESLVNVSRYIVANPLRAGIVEHVGDYPFWDSVWLE